MTSTIAIADRRARILEGPVGRALFALSWPMSLGLFSVIAFNVVDTLYIGRLGPEPLAAMGYSFPVIFGLSAVSIGMGNGAASVVARAIGAGEHERARELTLNTVLFVGLVSIALSIFMVLYSDTVFSLLRVPESTMAYVDQYMDVWYLGLPFLMLPIVLNGLIRATGEARVPSLLMVVGALMNAALSPLLVFGLLGFPELGMSGAAWSTIAARFGIAAFCMIYLFREKLIRVSAEALGQFIPSMRQVLAYGVPAFLAQLVSPIAGFIVTRLMSDIGPNAVAAYAIGARIEALALVPFFALQTGVGPFVGQNVGAGNIARLRRAEGSVILFSIGWGIVAGVITVSFGHGFASWFTDDDAIRLLTDSYLNFLGFGLWGAGLMVVAVGILNPLGYPRLGMTLSALRYLVLFAGGAALAAHFAHEDRTLMVIYATAPGSYAIAGLIALFLVNRLLEKPRDATGRNEAAPRQIVGHDDLRPNRHPSERQDD